MVDAPVRTPKPALPTPSTKKSVGDLIGELRELVVAYAKQETIEPFKGLGRQLAWGLAGSFLLGIGAIFGAVAVLRALQTETGTRFTDRASWFPYLVTFFALGLFGIGAVSAARRKGK